MLINVSDEDQVVHLSDISSSTQGRNGRRRRNPHTLSLTMRLMVLKACAHQ